jgi:hypothetical protein
MIADEVRGKPSEYRPLGTMLAEGILSRGGQAMIDQAYQAGGGSDAC